MLRDRDEPGVEAAMRDYLQTQCERFASDAAVAEARVSYPDIHRILWSIEH